MLIVWGVVSTSAQSQGGIKNLHYHSTAFDIRCYGKRLEKDCSPYVPKRESIRPSMRIRYDHLRYTMGTMSSRETIIDPRKQHPRAHVAAVLVWKRVCVSDTAFCRIMICAPRRLSMPPRDSSHGRPEAWAQESSIAAHTLNPKAQDEDRVGYMHHHETIGPGPRVTFRSHPKTAMTLPCSYPQYNATIQLVGRTRRQGSFCVEPP